MSVSQAAHQARFAFESGELPGGMRGEQLDSHRPAQAELFGEINFSHAPSPSFFTRR